MNEPADSGAGKKTESPFRVVELATVTDEEIEDVLNKNHQEGLTLEAIHFAMRESSKRPAMAFLIFRIIPPGRGGP